MSKTCEICGKPLEKVIRSDYHEKNEKYYCKKCYKNIFRSESRFSSENTVASSSQISETNMDNENVTVTVDLPSVRANGKKCIFGCPERRLRLLSIEECLEVFIKTNIYVKYGVRVCVIHGEGKNLQIPDNFTPILDKASMSATDILSIVSGLKQIIQKERNQCTQISFLDVEEKKLIFETGLNKSQFQQVLSYLAADVKVRDKVFALGVYLSRLRRGYTYDELSSRWNIHRKSASKYCDIVRTDLVKFANDSLNLSCSRNELLRHRTETSKRLHSPFEDLIIVVLDGTYIFIEKSGNFAFQRLTYSGHKHRNLIKPMMAVCPDGYIVGVWGPYPGNMNDATIMKNLLSQNIWGAFQAGDILVVDRGFRDVMDDITNMGFVGKMPPFANTPSAQLMTEQANNSRTITKIRYIVEVINGRIKKWFKYFDKTIHNTTLSYLFNDFKIACLLHNIMFKPITSSSLDIEIAERMLLLSNKSNNLSTLVADLNLNARRTLFRRLEVFDLWFPQLTMRELHLYTCGSYQIKMASSYYQDHSNEDGDFEFEVATEESNINYKHYNIQVKHSHSVLLKVRLRSRHSNNVKYFAYVLVDKQKQNIQAIVGHTCTCKVGKRIVGCCSHVTTIIWYFGFARHETNILLPAHYLNTFFVDDTNSISDNSTTDSGDESNE